MMPINLGSLPLLLYCLQVAVGDLPIQIIYAEMTSHLYDDITSATAMLAIQYG